MLFKFVLILELLGVIVGANTSTVSNESYKTYKTALRTFEVAQYSSKSDLLKEMRNKFKIESIIVESDFMYEVNNEVAPAFEKMFPGDFSFAVGLTSKTIYLVPYQTLILEPNDGLEDLKDLVKELKVIEIALIAYTEFKPWSSEGDKRFEDLVRLKGLTNFSSEVRHKTKITVSMFNKDLRKLLEESKIQIKGLKNYISFKVKREEQLAFEKFLIDKKILIGEVIDN